MTPPTRLVLSPAKPDEPPAVHRCHCEPQRGVAISWYNERIGTQYQEIPTGFALGMTDLGDYAFVWHGRSRYTISALRRSGRGTRPLRWANSICRGDSRIARGFSEKIRRRLTLGQLFQGFFVDQLHGATGELDHVVALEVAQHPGDHLPGGA